MNHITTHPYSASNQQDQRVFLFLVFTFTSMVLTCLITVSLFLGRNPNSAFAPWRIAVSKFVPFISAPQMQCFGPNCSTASKGSKNQLWHLTKAASNQYQIAPELVWAVISVESNFNSKAVSRAGAKGLMQLMPITAKSLNVTDPHDPSQNIYAGAKYLSELIERYNGNKEKALAAYNAGPERVKQHRGIPPFRETRRYISKVMKAYHAELAKRDSYTS